MKEGRSVIALGLSWDIGYSNGIGTWHWRHHGSNYRV